MQSCVIEYQEDRIETRESGVPGASIMKQEMNKTKRQKHPANVKTAKPVCGTLSFMAECRGATKKAGSIRCAAPPDSIDQIGRK